MKLLVFCPDRCECPNPFKTRILGIITPDQFCEYQIYKLVDDESQNDEAAARIRSGRG